METHSSALLAHCFQMSWVICGISAVAQIQYAPRRVRCAPPAAQHDAHINSPLAKFRHKPPKLGGESESLALVYASRGAKQISARRVTTIDTTHSAHK